ncbi:hypothetical protein JKF63_07482 [Porcisia hertigi]|uniref:Uncharacterized protein n=1 Tax=Porcisia hertigi TaxID=2761500 RepID=A0A836INV8_9TRYP|nr:hypothetical protein JKF63_07482 [Porcisia hertigi]
MSGGHCATPCLSSKRLEEECESHAVDSRLLYNDIEQLSGKRFEYGQRLIRWSRLLSAASMVAAGVCGLAVYYQRAKIHRVWRLRHPRKVQRLAQLAMTSGCFSFFSVLFLISPIGFLHVHEKEEQRMKQLDAIAVTALVQEQNFRTVAAWAARIAAGAPSLALASHASTAPPSSSADTTDTEKREGTKKYGAEPEPQWVWTNVVLDPTQLLQSSPYDRQSPQKTQASLVAKAAGPQLTDPAAAAASADATIAATKKQLASQLLVRPEHSDDLTRGDSEATLESRLTTWRERPRRVWGRTAEPEELQRLKDECVVMWKELVSEKMSIVSQNTFF